MELIKQKENKTIDFFKQYDAFLKENKKGKRLQKNGKRIKASSQQNYVDLRKMLWNFSSEKQFVLRLNPVSKLGKRALLAEKNYWKKFYLEFTSYLYDDLDCYDNFVGGNIKKLRAFFNYLNNEKELKVGNFHKLFYAPVEEVEIVTLMPEQLNFLIYDKTFEEQLPDYLKRIKDIFVFGCTVALRFSDLLKLTMDNVERVGERYYLKVTSKKTNTFTKVLLPEYAMEIIRKKPAKQQTIFTPISIVRFNLNVKILIERTPWTQTMVKVRTKKGVAVQVYKDKTKREHYRFCDLITSHTMRRTAITTMLCLNMPETMVRKISGHAPNSKEFFRYVQLSQHYMDEEAEKIFEQIKNRKLG